MLITFCNRHCFGFRNPACATTAAIRVSPAEVAQIALDFAAVPPTVTTQGGARNHAAAGILVRRAREGGHPASPADNQRRRRSRMLARPFPGWAHACPVPTKKTLRN
jgi:hypothetical protein